MFNDRLTTNDNGKPKLTNPYQRFGQEWLIIHLITATSTIMGPDQAQPISTLEVEEFASQLSDLRGVPNRCHYQSQVMRRLGWWNHRSSGRRAVIKSSSMLGRHVWRIFFQWRQLDKPQPFAWVSICRVQLLVVIILVGYHHLLAIHPLVIILYHPGQPLLIVLSYHFWARTWLMNLWWSCTLLVSRPTWNVGAL